MVGPLILAVCALANRCGVKRGQVGAPPFFVRGKPAARRVGHAVFSRGKIAFALMILGVLIFSKYFYMASISSYYTFYLIDKFQVSVQGA
jgi:hypothetical protein